MEPAMPNWVVPLLAFIVLVGFIGFAFRQGMEVTPDHGNPDNIPPGGGSSG
jgi:hypothetical protein